MRRLGLTLAILGATTLFMAPTASAKAPWTKKGQEVVGKDVVKNCASCHTKALPTAKDAGLNALGDWLMAQKKAKGAKEVDLAWLKEYKPAAK